MNEMENLDLAKKVDNKIRELEAKRKNFVQNDLLRSYEDDKVIKHLARLEKEQ
jgi:hypothetical protein